MDSGLAPDAAVLGPSFIGQWPKQLAQCATVSVNVDRSADGMSCVELDGPAAAEMAAHHLLSRGYRHLTSFRSEAWGMLRDRHFRNVVAAAGASLAPPWEVGFTGPPELGKGSEAVMRWLSQLPKPCGFILAILRLESFS